MIKIITWAGALLLTGCAAQPVYHGVPEATWKTLTAQQKQLIIDRSFQDDLKK
jgi:hypothetical protein